LREGYKVPLTVTIPAARIRTVMTMTTAIHAVRLPLALITGLRVVS
jgi:hypothetical protein